MNSRPLLECVPNFSEGRDTEVIRRITEEIAAVEGVLLLDVDPGKATNRTVVTFVGEPEAVVEAAFRAIVKAAELIDMRQHRGEHPRMGATDVCPLIPVANLSMEETVQWARKLSERVGAEAGIPVYLYEYAATRPARRNLATIRAGEYEGLAEKMKDPDWQPDFGPTAFHALAGATVIGARDFLVAYNVNLNTVSERRANSVAFDVREQGRILRKGHPVTGEIMLDEKGQPIRQPGTCRAVKGIGWYIPEYGIAQVSMNLTNLSVTPLHKAFEACCESAEKRGLRVTGSELVGLVPLQVMLDAGRHFLRKQGWSTGLPEKDILHMAVKSMGLDELGPFDPYKKIIEYRLQEGDKESKMLTGLSLRDFADETSRDSPAPGGGSIAAYTGALGAALGTMVANLSAGKRGWEHRTDEFSDWAEKGQALKSSLLTLVDEDTKAFNRIMEAFRLPKSTETEITVRREAIEAATLHATLVPLQTMEAALEVLPLAETMVLNGNPNSVTDAAVGAICAHAAVLSAWLNVKINAKSLTNKAIADDILNKSKILAASSSDLQEKILTLLEKKL
ncbi:MAG: hypothetical protein RLY31_880 [Bacteroidota bacterium]